MRLLACAALSLLSAETPVTIPAGSTSRLLAQPRAMIPVPAGTFRMGATPADVELARRQCADEMRGGEALPLELSPRCHARFEGETPQEEVFVPGFAIDRTEVTVAEYAACVRQKTCRDGPDLRLVGGDPRLPLERVTWYEAAAFCRHRGGRLPSEAEWEKAARGFGRRAWPWGSSWRGGRANHGRSQRVTTGAPRKDEDALEPDDGFAERAPVGSFPRGASPYGAQDLAGNVWEWTSGQFSRAPPQAATGFDPRGPQQGDERTIRGGGYRSPPSDLRVTRRVGLAPGERLPGVGFRCAYDPPPTPLQNRENPKTP